MTLPPHEFIRRFLMHVSPHGFHRIRHYGLLANANRAESIAKARRLLARGDTGDETRGRFEARRARSARRVAAVPVPRRRCGGRMIIIEVFARGQARRGTSRHRAAIATQDRHVMNTSRSMPDPRLTYIRIAGPPPASPPLVAADAQMASVAHAQTIGPRCKPSPSHAKWPQTPLSASAPRLTRAAPSPPLLGRDRRSSIPIAPAAPPATTSRDFVPWRFSDAGHRALG